MDANEIIAIMNKPKTTSLVPKYKTIYQISTGKPWKSCLCGNGFNTLWQTCKNYANALAKQQLNNTQ